MVAQRGVEIQGALTDQECQAILKWAVQGSMSLLVNAGFSEENCFISSHKFSHGQSNPTFLLTVNPVGQNAFIKPMSFVLRAQPHGKLLPGAHRVDREFKVLSALAPSSVPVPRVYSLCTDNSVIGRMFYTMEFLEGRIFKDASLQQVRNENEKRSLYMETLRVLIEISKINVVTYGLQNLSKHRAPWIDRQIATWYKQYRLSQLPGVDYSNMETLHEKLIRIREHKQVKEQPSMQMNLVHGDYRIDNLVFHPTEPRCIGVLDWELVSLGEPLADLASFLCPFYMPKEAANLQMLQSTCIPRPLPPGIPPATTLINLYTNKRGVNDVELQQDLLLYIAVAMFRFAGILCGVQARGAQGNASSRHGEEYGSLWYLFARAGLAVLEKQGHNQAEMKSSSPRLREKLIHFMKDVVLPAEDRYFQHITSDLRWTAWPEMEELKSKARKLGLWNLFLPKEYDGTLSSTEYAPLAEEMGRCVFAAEVFNCSAPDTGNMELLARYGTVEQKEKWLHPLLNGEIRSCFAMTEPQVASSDATNLSVSITRIGPNYVINGRKWWTSGAMDPRCKLILLIGKGPEMANAQNTSKHKQHTIVLIPMETPGVRIVRHLTVFGYDDAPHGHAEIEFTNVVVDAKASLLHTEGGGFEAAQSRLGGGRLHHCMRAVGCAERALELTVSRALSRQAFGKRLVDNDSVLKLIGQSRCDTEAARALTLAAAYAVDSGDTRATRAAVAIAKIQVPKLVHDVVDRAVQIHGGMGVCQDTVLAMTLAHVRTLRLADGPDEVHQVNLAKAEVKMQMRRYAKL